MKGHHELSFFFEKLGLLLFCVGTMVMITPIHAARADKCSRLDPHQTTSALLGHFTPPWISVRHGVEQVKLFMVYRPPFSYMDARVISKMIAHSP
jgi:hypothetical protein